MKEIYPGMFQINLRNTAAKGSTLIHIYLIPGGTGQRSLMIDAGYRTPENKQILTELFRKHQIAFEDLDIFLTHKHHDHTGLANFCADRHSRIFMNPEEDRHPYDCLYYNNNEQAMEEQVTVLRRVGITKERTPILWERFMEMNRQVQNETRDTMYNEKKCYTYLPIEEGQMFCYGNYRLKAFHLKGHTFGQMGLCDEEHKLVFPADQIIDGIVPIVGTAYTDEHLLDYFLRSLEDFKERYRGYTVHPSHMEPYPCSGEVADRILTAYRKKLDVIRAIIAAESRLQTVQEIAFLAYGITKEAGWADLIQTKMVITKTFSCLEYLYDLGEIRRTEEDGTLLWGTRG